MMSMGNIAHTWCTTSKQNPFLSRVLQIIALISSRLILAPFLASTMPWNITWCLSPKSKFIKSRPSSLCVYFTHKCYFITMFNFELLKISYYSIIIFCSEYFNPRRAMLWNSLVPKDKILQGNTCLKMIYKFLEY